MYKPEKIGLTIFLLLCSIALMAQEKRGGHINIKMADNDSMHIVTATVTDSVTARPLQNIELTFYIQRMFGIVNVGKATTDTMGVASAEIPKNLRADGTGKVIFITKVENSDVLNDASMQMILKPDIPYLKNKPIFRAMSRHSAPWWLIITFSVILGTVSLLFLYVLYLVYRIKKASMIKIIS